MIFASVRHNVRGRRGGRQPREACPLPLPDRPSIAALPLDNVSGNKDQDYFRDGITDDTITELSRFSELFVIARNPSFQYRGRRSTSGRWAHAYPTSPR